MLVGVVGWCWLVLVGLDGVGFCWLVLVDVDGVGCCWSLTYTLLVTDSLVSKNLMRIHYQ